VRRLLLTGVSGYLGHYLAGAARSTGDGCETTGTYFSQPTPAPRTALRQVDLRDRAAVRQLLADVQPNAVIHTACSNRDEANVLAIVPAATNLALACHERGVRLVHVSTDLVFDGEHAPYSDDSPPAPVMPYGRAKAEAEAAVLRLCPAAAIGRPSLIWALDPLDRQTRWLVDGVRSGAPVTLFTDEIRCPVYLGDLAAALLELAALPQVSGTLNLGGRQPLSRWNFGLRLLQALRLERAPNLVPGTIAELGLVRARNLSLDCRRAGQLLSTGLRGVDEVLASAPCRALPIAQHES
jgi:dTDP-4-dehydrorhamnose reductase